jgi:uncharacterized protein (DUF488 family)
MSQGAKKEKREMTCFTIGHSDHSFSYFVELLKKYDIDSLIDIRSMPYSQRIPQFNKEIFSADLKSQNILYGYFGNRLGGRYTNPDLLFENGKVDYNKVKKTQNFIIGIEKIIKGIKEHHRIALMCSEKDPFDCHRFILVACVLEERGVTIKHILEDGNYVLNKDLERKLLNKYKFDYQQFCMFVESRTKKDALDEALKRRNLEIAFSINEGKK